MAYNEEIVAGIVTYNPEMERLITSIKKLNSNNIRVIIVDNNSECVKEIHNLESDFKNIRCIYNSKNEGIAKALNQIMEVAYSEKAKWVLTLDHDSIIPDNMIQEYQKMLNYENIGIITSQIIDSRINKELIKVSTKECEYTNKCITAGALTNIEAWKQVGGFNEKMFIDYVDYDFSAKLDIHKFKILRLNNVYLYHQLGDAELKKILGKSVRITNHSAFRKYYIGRNIVYFIRQYNSNYYMIKEILRLLKVFAVLILWEDKKQEKIINFFKGMRDGCVMQIEKQPQSIKKRMWN